MFCIMGQDQSKPGGTAPASTQQQQQHAPRAGSTHSTHMDPASNTTSRAGSPQAAAPHGSTAITASSAATAPPFATHLTASDLQHAAHLRTMPRVFVGDEEVTAIWSQIQQQALLVHPPLLRSTALPPEKELEAIKESLAEERKRAAENQSNNDNNQTSSASAESSPTAAASAFFAELKRKALSAASSNSPSFGTRCSEIARLQKGVSASSPSPASAAFSGALASNLTTAGSASTSSHAQPAESGSRASVPPLASSANFSSSSVGVLQQTSSSGGNPPPLAIVASDSDLVALLSEHSPLAAAPLAALAPAPLLQTLGRTQTICTREVSKSLARSETVVQTAKQMAVDMEGLKAGAVHTVRVGQRCYAVETEVKKLHLELHGDTRSTAITKAIGHDTAFSPLAQVCRETVQLIDEIHKLLRPEAKEALQEFARGIDARALGGAPSPLLPPLNGSFASNASTGF